MMRQRHRMRSAVLAILLASCFTWGLVLPALAQTVLPGRLARPQAVPEGSAEEVPPDLALKIVIDEATARWARFAVGSPILCSDDNGKLVAYMIPVRLNTNVFPSDRELILSHAGPSDTHGTDWGAGDYWTFVVSARERDFPIPCEFNTLPPFFVTSVRARDAAAEELQTTNLTLTRYYFLGHRGEYFEFSEGDKTVLIDAYRLNVCRPSRILIRKGQVTAALSQVAPENAERRLRRETYMQQVRDEWKRLKERAVREPSPR